MKSGGNEYEYISLGGWCGTKMALDQQQIVNQANDIFDHIRCSSKGIIDCLVNNFANFFPTVKEIDTRFTNWKPYIGEHFGFYHTGNMNDPSTIESFNRKIQRFKFKMVSDKKTIFIRTTLIPDYMSEVADMQELQNILETLYPSLDFIILCIIPDQPTTSYYKNIGKKLFLFTVNDKSYNNNLVGYEYSPIFDFIRQNDLFDKIPPEVNLTIETPSTRLLLVDGNPCVRYYDNLLARP
jgi:hypothetical protein